jgi:hypothetical protein
VLLVFLGDVFVRVDGEEDAIPLKTGDVDDTSRPGTSTISSNEAESIVSPRSDETVEPTESASDSS